MKPAAHAFLGATLLMTAAGCGESRGRRTASAEAHPPRPYALAGPLIPASTTMISAWDIPANPLADASLTASGEGEQIRWGFRIFNHTPEEAARFAHGKVSCSHCHLNAGQRERALPLVGISVSYPDFNRRAERPFSLEERIVDCFLRSENGTQTPDQLPEPGSREVKAVAAYLVWLSKGYPQGTSPGWRGMNVIPQERLLPIPMLDPGRGEELFMEMCINCHGEDGQGVQIGDKKAGPLWGSDSWNDGAGAARIYTLAGMIRHMMPYLDPGSLSDEEAQHIAAFIDSKPRPAYPFKARDYPRSSPPADAVYYKPPY